MTKETVNFLLVLFSSGLMGVLISGFYYLAHSRAVYSSKMSVALIVFAVLTAMLLYVKFMAGSVAVISVAIILRFRNPIKDHRDIVFVLLAVLSGFCCATHMYPVLGVALVVLVVTLGIFRALGRTDRVLMVVRGDGEQSAFLLEAIEEYSNDQLKLLENNSADEVAELIYEVKRCENPYEKATAIRQELEIIKSISEIHIMYQDDDTAI